MFLQNAATAGATAGASAGAAEILGPLGGFLILLSLVYWCFDEKKGLRFGLVVLASGALHILIGSFFEAQSVLFAYTGYFFGAAIPARAWFPSGHAQSAVVMWGLLIFWMQKKWFTAAAAAACLLAGLYRAGAGLDLPTEILGGWAAGSIVVFGYLKLEPIGEKLLSKGGLRAAMIACAALSFLLIFNRSGDDVVAPAGMILGIGAGYCLNKRYIGFGSSGATSSGATSSGATSSGATNSAAVSSAEFFFENTVWKKKIVAFFVRAAAGGAVLFLIMSLLRTHLPQYQGFGNYPLFMFAGFALPMLWICAGAPWFFIKLKAAQAALARETDDW